MKLSDKRVFQSNGLTPKNCLLWGTGSGFLNNVHLVKYYEQAGFINVCGITSNDPIHSGIAGYRFIAKTDIKKETFDCVIIMSSSDEIIREIKKEAFSYGIEDYDIVQCDVMKLLGFDFNKYRKIKSNPPTIFAPNCWGGVTYNRLGLRFESPFINMFEDHDDYIKFLMNPRRYIETDLKYVRSEYNGIRNYPIADCAGILLYFNHYDSFEDANTCWERRKTRIKWDNLFVMMYDEDPRIVEQFCALPYENKICFTTLRLKHESVATIEYPINDFTRKIPFGDIVNGMATGRWIYYNVFDLLLYNKITRVADFRTD